MPALSFRLTLASPVKQSANSESVIRVQFVVQLNGGFVEIQGTAEGEAFTPDELNAMLALAQKAIVELSPAQKAALAG